MVGQVAHQGPHGVQGLALLLPVQGGVYAEKARVGVVRYIGVHGVAQAPFLPQLLEQAGGAAPAQQGVEQQQLGPPLIQIGEGGEGQDQVVLFDGLLPGGDGGAISRGLGLGHGAGFQLGQAVAQAVHLLWRKAARQGSN